MKIKKGQYGYIRHEQIMRTVRTIVAFAIDFGIFAFGLYMNDGSRRNIYSIIAAVGCIPAAMSLVGMIMMLMQKPMKADLHERIHAHAGSLLMLYELFLTTHDQNLFLDAVAVCGEYVTAYTHISAAPGAIQFMDGHIRKSILQSGYKVTVKIFTNEKNFLERIDQLREKQDVAPSDHDEEVAAVIRQIAL
ncbi:MAG: hypothetical protein ACI4ET_00935 [Bilifractor sp.]